MTEGFTRQLTRSTYRIATISSCTFVLRNKRNPYIVDFAFENDTEHNALIHGGRDIYLQDISICVCAHTFHFL